jgi:hypothetical protein
LFSSLTEKELVSGAAREGGIAASINGRSFVVKQWRAGSGKLGKEALYELAKLPKAVATIARARRVVLSGCKSSRLKWLLLRIEVAGCGAAGNGGGAG